MQHFKSFVRGVKVILAPAAAVSLLAFNVCQAADPSDASVKAQVQQALQADKNLFSRHINVSVQDGVVRLGGFVQDNAALMQAQKDASAVQGVKSVKNEIKLKPEEQSSPTR